MTDRELLELAAKAAGYKIHIWGTKGKENIARMDLKDFPIWNPLTDDGDALRLAVKLRIGFTIDDEHHEVHAWSNKFSSTIKAYGTDNESVRLAIVRAAAEIGKTK